MCGIAGEFNYNGGSSFGRLSRLEKIANRMVSRGPDGSGRFVSSCSSAELIHRRLSIIDLTAAGAQPMVLPDREICVTFNGEIYNYPELKRELQAQGAHFQSNSDTEILLHLYVAYGKDFVSRLRGMFAFAIWDGERQSLFLARDHLGIKPLYYADDGTCFRFASQVKALVAAGDVDTSPCPAGQVGFMLLGYVPEPHTWFRGIRSLEAGTTLYIDQSGRCQKRNYFNVTTLLEQTEPVELAPSEAERQVREILLDSTRCHLISDVPVGMFLSSGVDSASIARLATDVGARDLRSITALFSDFAGGAYDETANAASIARALGFKHQNLKIQLEKSDLPTALDELLVAMDQPSVDGVNTYFISQAAKRNGMKVALSGLGGDELFGGYPLFRQIPIYLDRFARLNCLSGATRLLDALFSSKTARRFLKPRHQGLFRSGSDEASAYLLLRSVFHPWELPELLDPDLALQGLEDLNISERLTRITGQISTTHGRITALEMSMYMRNQLLMTSDWAGMAHSLEIRVPLVDVEVFKGIAPLLLSSDPPSKSTFGASAQITTLPTVAVATKVGFNVPVSQFMSLSTGNRHVDKANEYRTWAKFIKNRVETVA